MRRFAREERGNAAVVFALVLLPLLAGTGLALDSLLAFTVQERLQRSLDAAGLAAGQAPNPDHVVPDAVAFFRGNFDAAPGLATAEDPTVQVSSDGDEIMLNATATMPTRFMRLFGQNSVTVSANATINRQTQGMELALVLDITGSMVADNRIGGLKAASTELLQILYGNRNTVPNLWVGVVPYIAAVNVGTANIDFLDAADRARATPAMFDPDTWGGCVVARPAPRDRNDDPPNIQPFHSYLYPVVTAHPSGLADPAQWLNAWPPLDRTMASSGGVSFVKRVGPNAGCPTPITPLVAEKSTIVTAIDELVPEYRGGTVTNEGIAWGWRLISPRWRGRWAGSPGRLPLDYGTPNMNKVMVVITDGDNQMLVRWVTDHWESPYNTYENPANLGVTPTGATQATNATLAELNQRTTDVCNAVKAAGITIYAITFSASVSAGGQTLMRGCASTSNHYWHAPTNATLRTAFQAIGSQLNNLRVKR